MITYRWKQCPYCNKRYDFNSHSGATRGWEVEYFGSPTETCPNCLATISTGKVRRVSELKTSRKIRLFFSILLESFSALVWTIGISMIVTVLVSLYIDDDLSNVVGVLLFIFLIFKWVSYNIREYQKVNKPNYDTENPSIEIDNYIKKLRQSQKKK